MYAIARPIVSEARTLGHEVPGLVGRAQHAFVVGNHWLTSHNIVLSATSFHTSTLTSDLEGVLVSSVTATAGKPRAMTRSWMTSQMVASMATARSHLYRLTSAAADSSPAGDPLASEGVGVDGESVSGAGPDPASGPFLVMYSRVCRPFLNQGKPLRNCDRGRPRPIILAHPG